MEYEIYKSDELYHWGIKGMKWGVRRYQNKDGSLTPAGKKRRAKLEGELERLGGSNKKSIEDSVNAQPKKKTASEMDDNELAKAINRARMEDEYRRLRPEPQPVEKHSFMKQMVNDVVKPAMINSGRKLVESTMNQMIEKATKGKVDLDSIEVLKKTYEKLDYKQKIDKMLNPDKYLSEEDKTKRADREYKAEDRAAQMEGYQNAADKAKKEAEKKTAADEAARAANEARSRAYYESTYSQRGGESTRVYPSEERGMSVASNSSSNSVNSITTRSNVSNGESIVDYILQDSGGNPIRYFTSDDDVSYRR